MYNIEFDLSPEVMDPNFMIPIDKARVEKEGSDSTITDNAKRVGFSLEAAEILKKDHDIDVEVVNLRSIRPLDRNTIIDSVKKTNRIVNVEEGWP